MDSLDNKNPVLPLIPLRELVTFPSTIIPILVGRPRSINALKYAIKHKNHIFLSMQKNQVTEKPISDEICRVGVVAKIEKSAEQVNGSYRVIIHGIARGKIEEFKEKEDFYLVKVSKLEDEIEKDRDNYELARNLIKNFEEYINLKKVKLHGIVAKLESNQLSEITDIILSIINIPLSIKQSLLEETNVYERGIKVNNILKKENFRWQDGHGPDYKKNKDHAIINDIDEYKNKIASADLPSHVKKRVDNELKRLEMMPPFSAEGTVSRYFIDWVIAIPWKKITKENHDLKKAEEILEMEHYGLEKVKDRILDYLAVRQLVKKPEGEILCLVGPPGVGKSSLSKSIAHALDRKFVRFSLGGVKDEAEIRGHRRTYIGAYPGQIVKGLKKAKCMNPVFLLDEIDKLSSDFRGDPASALLETLDLEQNYEFVDHYLDMEIDLSKVFFITTANTVEPVPAALRDRMEIIEISGYTEKEKLEIGKRYLLNKQAEKKGLQMKNFQISDEIILQIINQYTQEAGVRNLERQIAMIMRKVAREIVTMKKTPQNCSKITVDKECLQKFLGVPKYKKQKVLFDDEIGVAIGLAWTISGGDILIIESRSLKGKGELILTGRLGEIMKESSSTAFSYTKLKLYELDFDINEIENFNFHVHIPEGAVPKEGPSAGVTLAVSLISLLSGIPVRSNFAMTGEITLRGKILPVGGIKEKIIAAHRYGIKNILIPLENERDYLEDVPKEIRNSLKIYFVDNMNEILDKVLTKPLKVKNINSRVIKPFLNSKIQ